MTLEEMKKRKKERGYSCRQIAELSGVPFGTVQKVFNGSTKAPRYETLQALEKVLSPENAAVNAAGELPDQYIIHTIPERGEHRTGSREDREKGEINYLPNLSPDPSVLLSDASDGKRVNGVVRETGGFYGEDYDGRPRQHTYSVADWERLPSDVHAELLNGQIFDMAAPSSLHQDILLDIAAVMKQFVKDNRDDCRVYISPIACRLFQDDRTMLLPDLLVVCDPDKIQKNRIEGAPDLVIEILSPSTRSYDMTEKLAAYRRAGVREYWMADPQYQRVIVYNFQDERVMNLYTFKDRVPVGIWNGELSVDFAEILEDISFQYT